LIDSCAPMAYHVGMEFLETKMFTRAVETLLPDDEYRALQSHLIVHPDAGDVIPGGGGIRKVRWAATGRGKRGGVRVAYYWQTAESICFMLLVYAKNEQTDLTPEQAKLLRRAVKEEFE
jgi:hypothetical protein